MKIRLSKTETVIVSEKRTIIDEENKVYRESGRAVPFGSVFLHAFNTELSYQSEAEEIAEQTGTSVGFPSVFYNESVEVPLSLIIEAINKKKLSPGLKAAITNNTETLPFTVTVHEDHPVLTLKGSPDSLVLYDLLKIFQYNIKIGLCVNCGRAFVRSTQDRYCELCKKDEALKKELTRQSNARRNKNPALAFQNRIRHRIEYKGPHSSYYLLISRRCPADTEESLVREWESVDQEYQSARKAYLNKYGGDEEAIKTWENALNRDWRKVESPNDLRLWFVSMI